VLAYFYILYEPLILRVAANTDIDYVVAGLVTIAIVMLTWRAGGAVLTFLLLFALFYFYLGNLFPGFLRHKGFPLDVIMLREILSFEGAYGIVIQIVGTWAAIFILYAGLAQGFGAIDIIVKGAFYIAKKVRYGVAQLPVITSLFFGSISGSAAANVAATGSFTIPLMKRLGFPPAIAGGIEAVASSGGQIMPPVMGATGFLMAVLLGESYVKIMLIGFIPALLFYMTAGLSVYWITKRFLVLPSATAADAEEVKLTRDDMVRLVPLIISLGVILYWLIYYRADVMRAGLYGIIALVAGQFLYELLHPRRRLLLDFARNILNGARLGAMPLAVVGVISGGMGLIVKVLSATALGPKISYMMVDLAQGMLPLLLLLVLVVCLLFGMAVSTLCVYILVVMIAAPALRTFGIPDIVVHFLVFYMGVLAFITPPVAPAALVASGIAGSSFMRTAWESVKIGIALILLPFTFINYPELLIISFPETLIAIAVVAIALLAVSYSIYAAGRGLWHNLRRVILILVGGIILLYPAPAFLFYKDVDVFMAVGILALLAGGTFARRLRGTK